MQPTSTLGRAALVALALALSTVGAGWAGDTRFADTFSGSFFFSSPPCQARQLPTFESLVPVPKIIDPFERDIIPVFCQLTVSREGKGVKKVKGSFEADLIVVDNNTGEAESFPVGSGKFRTNRDGNADFDFDLPAELFADGFESGDVSAWSYTRTDFSNRKKVDNTSVSCNSGSSSSQSD